MYASSSCLVALTQLWHKGILKSTQEEEVVVEEEEEEAWKGTKGAVASGHLVKAPVVFSQLWQASTLRSIEKLPQNLHNSAHIPCRMIPILF